MDNSVTTAYEQQVLDVVRAFALEVGGPRALQAVTPTASFEREIGFGSLERVELLSRLESEFGHELGERLLLIDTPRELAVAVANVGTGSPVRLPPSRSSPAATPPQSLEIATLSSVTDALWKRAEMDPARPHVYLELETGAQPITFGALRDAAAAVAAGLIARDLRPGDRVAIMLPTGFDFLKSFMGVMAAGMVPVPLYPPPRLERLEDYLLRQSGILANCEAKWLISVPEAAPIVAVLRQHVPSLMGIISVVELAAEAHGPIAHVRGADDDIALIQYTSGSTGDPKGVRLSHANLLANIRAMGEGLAIGPADIGVSWLPLYHDMGLIGTWLTSLVYGIPLSLMSPLSFLARPERWLWTIHQRRATLSAAPNFAYELCVRKIRDETIEGLDLSSWRCAINGAEPISVATFDRFARRFAQYGFHRSAMMPVYGLAESSVALAFPPPGREPVVDRVLRDEFEQRRRAVPASDGDSDALTFMSVGQPLSQHDVRLVDEAGHDVPDRVVGRLLFRGPSAMSEYFNNPVASARTVQDDGWLNSGDLAYRADNELFVTGREKDVIIKGGRNIIPQEIEEVAGDVPGVRKGNVVAFGSSDESSGTEKLVVVAESPRTDQEAKQQLESGIIERVAVMVGIPPDTVIVVNPGAIPKTSSGKIRRNDTRRLFESGRLGAEQSLTLRTRLSLLRGRITSIFQLAITRTMRMLYAVYVVIAGALAAIGIGIPVWLLVAVLPGRRPSFVLSRFCARVALRIVGCRVTVEGMEHLPRDGPLVLVSNHTSYADAISLIASLPLDVVFVAKQELKGWPLIGTMLRKGGHPMVDRWDLRHSIADANRATDILRTGEVVLFFPEGTFTRSAGLKPFKMGAFTAAAAAGCPVVPIALRGTRHVLPSGSHIPHPTRISLWIGEGLLPASDGWDAARDLRDRAWNAIARHCEE